MDTPPEFAHIIGWGADLDHANRPAYPRERRPNRLEGVHWHAPEQQAESVEVLRSNERPAMTPLFGTTVPPTGVSGAIRRWAFRFSENDLRHWLLLLGADRVNMVEGVVGDLGHGRVPNLYAETGGPAALKHNPAGVAKKALAVVAVVGLAYVLLARRADRSRTVSLTSLGHGARRF